MKIERRSHTRQVWQKKNFRKNTEHKTDIRLGKSTIAFARINKD